MGEVVRQKQHRWVEYQCYGTTATNHTYILHTCVQAEERWGGEPTGKVKKLTRGTLYRGVGAPSTTTMDSGVGRPPWL